MCTCAHFVLKTIRGAAATTSEKPRPGGTYSYPHAVRKEKKPRFSFSTTALRWKQLDGALVSDSPPSARNRHGMVAVGNEVYVFGGRTDSSDTGEDARGASWPPFWGHVRYCADTCSARCCAHAPVFSRARVLALATPGPGDTRGGTATVYSPHKSERAHRCGPAAGGKGGRPEPSQERRSNPSLLGLHVG